MTLRTLVVGLGGMGRCHAMAYHRHTRFEIVGYCTRSGRMPDDMDLPEAPHYTDYFDALAALKPDVVSINTYADTHAEYAIAAMRAGAHVFLEKPIATTVEDARRVEAVATETGKKVVVGYILRHHPSWQRFVSEAKAMGGPYVFRMNLNQQSHGQDWAHHKALLASLSPIVDCGVHYLDIMCSVAESTPVAVHAIGLKLADDIDTYNYGQLQIRFADGSVGWYEAGWGPMMSETAYFVKDIITPNGAVSIEMSNQAGSANQDSHTKTNAIRVHRADRPAIEDTVINLADEPDHQALCEREQAFLYDAITQNLDLSDSLSQAVQSLAIALAADQSVVTGQVVDLGEQ
ncbi:MAG: Gfo/Idh/MocA family oxidoreductase [Gammaproteobacteria bacterium]|nr:Gfo/Idh/MocA family oxidoreductase [Gammaproteobacteria bacterium]